MKKLLDLRFLFTVVAVLELFYFLTSMVPPDMVRPLTGWNLNADGHWITKLMGISLLTQAYIAWIFRKNPHIGVAKGLAFYQMASASADWIMWLAMKNEGIFDNPLARTSVIAAIVSHYVLGILIFMGINRTNSHG